MPVAISNVNDIMNKKFGKLTVVAYCGVEYKGKNRNHKYKCVCDCGNKDIIATRQILLRGDKTSCGCAHKDAGLKVKESLLGKRFGRWIVIDSAPNRVSKSGKSYSIMWKCKCDCGTIKNVGARALKSGMSLSCGCLQKERVSEALTDNLLGRRFGYLTVVARNGSHCSSKTSKSGGSAVWTCKCDCGNTIDVLNFSLKNGDTTSCGCKKSSKYEMYTEQYLQSCGYVSQKDYFREKTFDGLTGVCGRKLRFDFYVKLHNGENILIECQGAQHYESVKYYGGKKYFDKLKKHDQIKKEFAAAHGYRLIEVNYKNELVEDVYKCLKDNNVY